MLLSKNLLECMLQTSRKIISDDLFIQNEMLFSSRRSIYNRYVDPTGGRQNQAEPNRPTMPSGPSASIPAAAAPPPPSTILQNNQANNQTETSNTKVEETTGGAKHIDPKLIEMITSEVNLLFDRFK